MSDGVVTVHEYVLSEEQLDALADRLAARVADIAARRAIEMLYANAGKRMLSSLARLIGFLALCVLVFLAGKNALPAR